MNNRNWLTLWNNPNERPLSELRREMDRLFDDIWSVAPAARQRGQSEMLTPACDVQEKNDHFLLTLDMPGIAKDDVKIEVIENQLTVSGERRFEKQSDDENGAWYSERRYGTFQRSFALPAGVDADKIEAQHRDGVLKLMIPKAEVAKPRQVKITDGSPGLFGKFLGSSDSRKKEDEKIA